MEKVGAWDVSEVFLRVRPRSSVINVRILVYVNRTLII